MVIKQCQSDTKDNNEESQNNCSIENGGLKNGGKDDSNNQCCYQLKNDINTNLSLIFTSYENMIKKGVSYIQSTRTNDLFSCSAKLHIRGESDSNPIHLENCFQKFEYLETTYEEDFGICYSFFAKNYSIFLKDDDYIQIDIKYETIED